MLPVRKPLHRAAGSTTSVSPQHRPSLSGAAAALVAVFAFAAPVAAQTQIIRDGSIGPDAGFQPFDDGFGVYEIGEGFGDRAGANLFHSFDFFDVGSGDTALFTADVATDNVISRVPGGSRSEIFGTIQSDIAGADVWLLNPNGVFFGDGATVDTQGVFRVSTADAVIFDDLEWPTGVASMGPLSTLPPSAYGFTSPNPEPITFDVSGLDSFDKIRFDSDAVSAVGGDIEVIGRGQLNAPGAVVEFTSVAGPAEVPVAGLDVDSIAPEDLGTVSINNRALLTVRRLVIRSGQFEVLQASTILADAGAAGGSLDEPAVDVESGGLGRGRRLVHRDVLVRFRHRRRHSNRCSRHPGGQRGGDGHLSGR